ncbi:MAG: alpha/beta hydrolase [Coriobacteriaceae bacterium]
MEGDNHTQFGDYGTQDGDGTVIVSAEDQQEQTAGAVAKFMQAA